MKKPKSRKRKRDRTIRKRKSQDQKQRLPAGGRFLSPLSFGWKIFVGLSVVMTVVGTIYAFYPKVSVSSSSSLDPSNPFATPFIISNDSYLSIYTIDFSCNIRQVEAVGSKNFAKSFRKKFDTPPIPRMDSSERATVFCPFMIRFPAPITRADIDIVVSYRPSWIPWRQEKLLRFATAKNIDNLLYWFPRSNSR